MKNKLQIKLFFLTFLLGTFSQVSAQQPGNPVLEGKPTPVVVSKPSPKLNSDLLELEQEYRSKARSAQGRTVFQTTDPLLQVQNGRVIVDLAARDVNALQGELRALGFESTATYGRIVSGWLPIGSVGKLPTIKSLAFAQPAYKPLTQVGLTTSQGDTAQRSDIARKLAGVDGLGTKIGVLSDSYNNRSGAEAGIKSGDLPGPGNPNGWTKPVEVLLDLDEGGSDEGRAMLEIIHDVAPGAELAYHTAFTGQAGFAQGIVNLANAGSNVIVDDVVYLTEPFFQDGIIAQAVDSVKKLGVTYFSSAGNSGRGSYESEYRSSTDTLLGAANGTSHNFSAPGDEPRYLQPISIPARGTLRVAFQWDDSYFSAGGEGAKTDMDIFLLDNTGQIVALSISNNLGGDPTELFGYTNTTSNTNFSLVILKYSGPDPRRLKYVFFGSGVFFLTTPPIPGILSSTLVGHANAAGALATAAAFYLQTPPFGVNPPAVEGFSAKGGTPILRDLNGNPIEPIIRQKPDIMAPDGANTTFFTTDIVEDTDTFPNFFGTSAAAPHAAAVAALMIEARRRNDLTPERIKSVLEKTALDADDPRTDGFDTGFDFRTGYGLIQADSAVQAVAFKPRFVINLNFTAACSEDPGVARRWRIRNFNSFNVRVEWEILNSREKGVLIAKPGENFFFTPASPGVNVAVISWNNAEGQVRKNLWASLGVDCDRFNTASAREGTDNPDFSIVTAYPNPFTDQFNLLFLGGDGSDVRVRAYDVHGKEVLARTLPLEMDNNILPVQLSGLPNGLYVLRVGQGLNTQTLKVVKQ